MMIKQKNMNLFLMAGLLLILGGRSYAASKEKVKLYAVTKEKVMGDMINASRIVWSDGDLFASMYEGRETKRQTWNKFLNSLGEYIKEVDSTLLSDKKLIAMFNKLRALSTNIFNDMEAMSGEFRTLSKSEKTRRFIRFERLVRAGKLDDDLKALSKYRASRLTSAKKKEAAGVLIAFAELINNHVRKITADYDKSVRAVRSAPPSYESARYQREIEQPEADLPPAYSGDLPPAYGDIMGQ